MTFGWIIYEKNYPQPSAIPQNMAQWKKCFWSYDLWGVLKQVLKIKTVK